MSFDCSMSEASDAGEYMVGGFGPLKRARLLIVSFEELRDRTFQFAEAAMRAGKQAGHGTEITAIERIGGVERALVLGDDVACARQDAALEQPGIGRATKISDRDVPERPRRAEGLPDRLGLGGGRPGGVLRPRAVRGVRRAHLRL